MGTGGGWQGVQIPDRDNLGPDQMGRGQLGTRQGQQGPDGGRGTGGRMVG